MKNITLEVRDKEYPLLLKFLRTLQYVKIKEQGLALSKHGNQLSLLKQRLDNQSGPLFKNIEDPLEWQKKIRDEWE